MKFPDGTLAQMVQGDDALGRRFIYECPLPGRMGKLTGDKKYFDFAFNK